uniref:Uncharacterized protein n=1 Tax=Arcella intermedia TaxID=1963864 RepID=A0A6B2L8J1_9EUKA
MSRSISILGILLGSILEFISGLMNHLSRRWQIIKTKDYYTYPVGKRRLETLTIIVFSTSMVTLTGELLIRSVQKMAYPLSISLSFGYLSISLVTLTVLLKFLLWVNGKRHNSARVQELAQDHLMDIFADTIGLLCGLLGYYYWPLLDPIGGLVLGLFMMTKWALTGIQNVQLMSGKTADPQILTMLTHIAAFHHPKIKAVDSVRAYYVSNRLVVEIDIVLPEDMKLKEAHDIGESLQYKIEKLPGIERAFVHLDFEIEHRHLDEHPTLIKLHSKFNTKELLHPQTTPTPTPEQHPLPPDPPIPFKQTT